MTNLGCGHMKFYESNAYNLWERMETLEIWESHVGDIAVRPPRLRP